MRDERRAEQPDYRVLVRIDGLEFGVSREDIRPLILMTEANFRHPG